jgi:hypothetical protein
MDQYTEVPGARTQFKCRAINWNEHETLKIDADYPDWERTVFQLQAKSRH